MNGIVEAVRYTCLSVKCASSGAILDYTVDATLVTLNGEVVKISNLLPGDSVELDIKDHRVVSVIATRKTAKKEIKKNG